jgi:hypothetical protein
VADEDTVQEPIPPPPSWITTVLRQPLSRLQALVGISAGLLTISGGFLSMAGFSTPAPLPQGEIVALVQDRVSHKPIADATVEILTRDDALVTAVVVEAGGTLTRRLKEGQYRLRVSHAAFGTEVRHIEVQAGQRSDVRIALAPRPPARVVRTVSNDSPGPIRKFFKDLGF